MKILAVSLLRLGDFLMIGSTIKGLKTQSEGKSTELHVLVHKEVLLLKDLFPEVDVWHVMDRGTIQAGLGSSNDPFLLSHDLLLSQVTALSELNFDRAINLTHTEFSGWVCGAIDAKDRVGIHYGLSGQPTIYSSWFQYLNSHLTGNAKDIFHLSDVIYYGCGLKGTSNFQLETTELGEAELKALSIDEPYIAIQLFTSDVKKNWSVWSWREMMKTLSAFRPGTKFLLLGAPSESTRIHEFCEQAVAQGVNCYPAICSLEGALSILTRAELLITGDTSIKHLAAGTNTPIIEICLGSSDHRKTGVYKQDSLIIRSRVACAPCGHSNSCHQPSHLCAEKIPEDAVALVAHHFLDRRWNEVRKIATEYSDSMELYQAHICPMGFWYAQSLSEQNDEVVLQALLERSTLKFILQKDYLNPIAQFGSEGVQIKRWLKGHLPDWNPPRIKEGLNFIESEAEATDQEIHSLLNTLRRITERPTQSQMGVDGFEELKSYFENSEGMSQILPWLIQLQDLYSDSKIIPITGLRKVQNRLDEVFQRIQVKLKLIRSIKHQIDENI